MIKLLKDISGWPFAVIKGDTHQAKWCEEQQSIVTDQTVPVRIVPHLKPGMTVVDAGANIGSHTVAYARAVGENGTVHAFEPFLDAYVCLAFNCRDLPQVKLHHCALGNEKCRVKIQPDENAGATYIVPRYSKDLFNELPGADVIALDSLLLPELHFLKMDVEGYEPLAIRGALETIKRHRPIIFLELNKMALGRHGFGKAAVLQPLTDLGYSVKFTEPEHNLDYEQIDIFLMP